MISAQDYRITLLTLHSLGCMSGRKVITTILSMNCISVMLALAIDGDIESNPGSI